MLLRDAWKSSNKYEVLVLFFGARVLSTAHISGPQEQSGHHVHTGACPLLPCCAQPHGHAEVLYIER